MFNLSRLALAHRDLTGEGFDNVLHARVRQYIARRKPMPRRNAYTNLILR